ncbi:hypothetical protein BpHYR1_048459 [Brachionus plicatilis]|uniref:Uncharacterized protein n=1 Tax=Brachionus plicatilis TaxID=10195 RepID=A0A3M7PKR7_BRAPC|nr:hypothetical protein BpHYR1_048459 [Brachionus plicatilis]
MVRGGGLAIYVRCDVESFEVSDEVLSNTRSKQKKCNVKSNDEIILVGSVYKAAYADGELNFEINRCISHAIFLCISSSSKSLLVAGKNFLILPVLFPTLGTNIQDLVVTSDPARVFRGAHGSPLGFTEKDGLHATLT